MTASASSSASMPSCDADLAHAVDQIVEIDRAKTEVLAARRDRRRNLVRFRGAENEHRPRRRLFDGLQQRVEGFVRNLVRFVDDENLVAVARGLIADVLAQFAHFIDAAIGRRVDLDDVDRSARRDFEAARANAAGLIGRAFFAVQAAARRCARWWFSRARAGRKRCSRARCGSARWHSAAWS